LIFNNSEITISRGNFSPIWAAVQGEKWDNEGKKGVFSGSPRLMSRAFHREKSENISFFPLKIADFC
jgi:hypothetical protein